MKKIYICFLFIPALIYGQGFAPVGTSVAQFLEVGMGARPAGMGAAYTTLPQDAGAVFWNPAGLVDIKNRSFFTSYNQWPAEIVFVGASFAMNIDRIGTIAISTQQLMTDDMEITTIDQPNGTGQMFNISNYVVGLSYARFLTNRFSIGLTGKVVHEKYWQHGYTTWGLDLGTIYRTDFHGLRIGMSILHFGPEVTFDGEFIDYSDSRSFDADKPKSFESHSMPINFRFGISFDVVNNEQNRITTAMDMIHPNNNLERYNVGLEYGFKNMFFLRGGYQLEADEGGLCFGTGVQLPVMGDTGFVLDYAYSDMGVLEQIHRFSFAFSF
jgi:hypothetical protein